MVLRGQGGWLWRRFADEAARPPGDRRTHADLAKVLGVTAGAVGKWTKRNAEQLIPPPRVLQVAEFFEVSLAEILLAMDPRESAAFIGWVFEDDLATALLEVAGASPGDAAAVAEWLAQRAVARQVSTGGT